MWAFNSKGGGLYLFVYCFAETGSHYRVQTGPQSESSCLGLLTAGITVMPHQSQFRTLMGKANQY